MFSPTNPGLLTGGSHCRKGLSAAPNEALGTKPPDPALMSEPQGGRATEGLVEYIRAKREVRHALIINDPQPVDNIEKMWLSAGSAPTMGLFLLLFGGFLYVGKAILLPVIAAGAGGP